MKNTLTSSIKNNLLIICLMAAYLIFSLTTYRIYGITDDEHNVFTRADALYQHLLTNNTDPNVSYGLIVQTYPKDVNPFYNNTYGMILRILNPKQNYEIYHLYTMLFVMLILIASYALIYSTTKSQWKAILGPLFLLLSPVFLGYVPVDPKDIPFAVFYFLSLTAIYFLGKKNSSLSILCLGLIFGLTQSGRVIGLTVYPILFFYRVFLSWDNLKKSSIKSRIHYLFQELLYLVIVSIVALFIMVITWPYLGSNFFKHFIKLFLISKTFPWSYDILYKGAIFPGNHLPGFYIPTVFLIKTPLFILFFLFGSLYFIKRKFTNNLAILLWITVFLNFVLYIGLRPVSELRHYLFIFPIVTTLAAVGCINFLIHYSKQVKFVVLTLTFLSIGLTIFNMFKLFPYDDMYFNELVGGVNNAKKNFTTDTYGQADKDGALWLAKYTKGKGTFNVFVCRSDFAAYYYFPSWLHNSNADKADYTICIPKLSGKTLYVKGELIHTFSKDGVVINRIYKNSKSL